MTTDYEYNLIGIDSVIYVEAAKDNIEVHTNEKTFRVHDGIKNFVKNRCPDFIFTHRSYAVNSDWIKTVTPTQIVLLNGEKLTISRQRYKTVCEKLKEIFK